MDLSIVTPAAPNRYERIQMIFNRLAINASRHTDISFEFIIVDDSLKQEYEALAAEDWPFTVKYISLPLIEPYPNPSYMRNVGFRVAEGKTFAMIDADHWVHEDFVWGAIQPGQDVLNTGFMIDTSKGLEWRTKGRVINERMIAEADNMSFDECMRLTGINGPVACTRVWLAAYPSEVFLSINGYDEHYCTGYSREDDDIYYRLGSRVPIVNKYFQSFAGVHLWHPQGARNDSKNASNRQYYDRMNPANAIRNINHEWGKFVDGAFSNLDGSKRGFSSHEQWIDKNGRVKPYLTSDTWKDFDQLKAAVI